VNTLLLFVFKIDRDLEHFFSLSDVKSRKSSISGDDRRSPPRYPMEEVRNPVDPFMNARVGQKPIEWPTDGQNMYGNEHSQLPQIEDPTGRPRKHSRTWEHAQQLQEAPYACEVVGGPDYSEYRTERQYTSHDMTDLPPRKRIHHGMISGFDIMNNTPLQAHNMTLQS